MLLSLHLVNVHSKVGASTCDDESENALLTDLKVPMHQCVCVVGFQQEIPDHIKVRYKLKEKNTHILKQYILSYSILKYVFFF